MYAESSAARSHRPAGENQKLSVLKYPTLVTKISGLYKQKAALHEAIVLPALRPDLFQGIRTPPKVLRRAKSLFCFYFFLFFLFQGIRLRMCSGALVASALLVLKYLLTIVLMYLLTSTNVLAYYSTEVPAY